MLHPPPVWTENVCMGHGAGRKALERVAQRERLRLYRNSGRAGSYSAGTHPHGGPHRVGVAGGIHAAEGRPESAARRVWRGCPGGEGLHETAGRRPGRDAFPGGRDRDPHETGLRRLRVGSCGRSAAGRTCQRDTGLPEDKRPGKRGLARFAGKGKLSLPRPNGGAGRLCHGPGMAGKAGGAA